MADQSKMKLRLRATRKQGQSGSQSVQPTPQPRKLDALSWNLTEKKMLVEALKRYSSSNIGYLAKTVNTKTAEEVEELIKAIQSSRKFRNKNKETKAKITEKAPLEHWLSLVQELIYYLPKDYSLFVSEMLGILSRCERFPDSGFENLKWSNIYKLLGGLSEENTQLQGLSDLESLVVLDLMHNLGDTLHSSDTKEQKQLLDMKYSLLRHLPPVTTGESISGQVAEALRNDFSSYIGGASNLPSSSSQTSTSEHHNVSISSATEMDARSNRAAVHESQSNNTKRDGASCSVTDKTGKEDVFVVPKLYTLNPLCVPDSYLAMRPKVTVQKFNVDSDS